MNIVLLPASAFCIEKKTAIINDGAQLEHISKVLSAKIGDELKIAMLGGRLGTGTITELGERCVLGDVELKISPPPKLDLTVVLALVRPKVLRRLVLDMTAMGVAHIILINSCRTDKSYWQSPLLGRLDEFVAEGLQQGVDTVAPTISFAKRFKPFVQDVLPALIANKKAVVAHPYANQSFAQVCQDGLPALVVIGAEGGFVPYEIDLLQSVGVQTATLGARILRTESAVNATVGRWLG